MSFRGFFLVLLSILLFLTAIVSVVGVSSFTLLDADSYLSYLEKYGVYNYVENNFNNTMGTGFLILPNQSVSALVELVVIRSFDYLNGRSEVLNLSVGFDDKKLRKFFEDAIEKAPVCSPGIGPEIANNLSCRPANESVKQTTDRILKERNFTIQEGSVNLADYLDPQDNLGRVREGVHWYKVYVYSFVAASLVLIGLILLVGWQTKSHGLRNIGIPLILVGIAVLSVFYFGGSLADGFVLDKIPELGISELNPALLVIDVLHGIYSKFYLNAGILFLIGLIALICSFVFVRRVN